RVIVPQTNDWKVRSLVVILSPSSLWLRISDANFSASGWSTIRQPRFVYVPVQVIAAYVQPRRDAETLRDPAGPWHPHTPRVVRGRNPTDRGLPIFCGTHTAARFFESAI